MKRWMVVAFALLMAISGVAFGQSKTVNKAGVEDLRYKVGTFTRPSRLSPGSTVTLHGVTPINALAYGVDATGASDCTDSLQVALDLGGDVYLPSGSYTVSGAISVSDSTNIIFSDGALLSGDCTVTVDGVISGGAYQVFGDSIYVVPTGDIYLSSSWWASADSVVAVAERADNATVVYPSGKIDLYGENPSFNMKVPDSDDYGWSMSVDGANQYKLSVDEVDQMVASGTGVEFSVPTRSAIYSLPASAYTISASLSNFIRIARTSKREFDTISGGSTGQEIRILLADTMSVLRESDTGNIELSQNIRFQRSGGVISLINYGGTWYEVSRSTVTALAPTDTITPPPDPVDETAPAFVSKSASWADVSNEIVFTVLSSTNESAKARARAYHTNSASSDTSAWTSSFIQSQTMSISTGVVPNDGDTFTIFVQAIDAAGNTSTWSTVGTYTISVYTPGPYPVITSTYTPSGNISVGAQVTVSGENFGAVGPGVISWDDFELGAAGAQLGAPSIGPTWTFLTVADNPTPYYSDGDSYSGSLSARVAWKEPGWLGGTMNGFGWAGEGPLNTIFMSYMRYQDSSIAIGGYPYNVKQSIMYGPIDHPGCVVGGSIKPDEHQWINAASGSLGTRRDWRSGQQTCPTGGVDSWGTGDNYTDSEEIWQRWDTWLDYEDDVADDDTHAMQWYDNRLVLDWIGNGADYDGTQYVNDIRIGLQFQDLASYAHAWCLYDDVYIAETRARVEIGDNVNFVSCTKRDIIPTTHWSDTEILLESFRAPSFSGGDTAYLFIVDADGNVSTGEEITIVSAGDLAPVGTAEFEVLSIGGYVSIAVTTPGGTDAPADLTAQWRLKRSPVGSWAPSDSTYWYTGVYQDALGLPAIAIIPGVPSGEGSVIYLPTALDSLECRARYKSAGGAESAWQSTTLYFGDDAGDTAPPNVVSSSGDVDCNGGYVEINLHVQPSEPANMSYRWKEGVDGSYALGTVEEVDFINWIHLTEVTALACNPGDTIFTQVQLADSLANTSPWTQGPTMYVPGSETVPAITSLESADLEDGTEFVLSGTDFGIKYNPGPILYDDVQNSYDGAPTPFLEGVIVPTRGTSGQGSSAYWAGAPWSQNATMTGYDNYVRFGVNPVLTRRDGNAYYKTAPKGAFEREWDGVDHLYVNWWWRNGYTTSDLDASGSTSNKVIRLWNADSNAARRNGGVAISHELVAFTEDANHDGDNDCSEPPEEVCVHGGGLTGRTTHRVWTSIALEVDSRNAGSGYGDLHTYVDNGVVAWIDVLLARDPIDYIKVLGFDPNIPDGLSGYEFQFTDIYVDSTFARCEIGNAAIYEECDHLEIQVCKAWTGTSVTFDFEAGSFSAGDTLYAFVTSKDRQHSNGLQFVYGGTSTADTTPPEYVITASDPSVDTTVRYLWGLQLTETGEAIAQWKQASSSTWAPDSSVCCWSGPWAPLTDFGETLLTGYTPADPDTFHFRIIARDASSNTVVAKIDTLIHDTGATTYHEENWLFSNNSTIQSGTFGHDIDSAIQAGLASNADSTAVFAGMSSDYIMQLRSGDNLPMATGQDERSWLLYFDIADSLAGKSIVSAYMHLYTYNAVQDLSSLGEGLVVSAVTDSNFAEWTTPGTFGPYTANYAQNDTVLDVAWTTHWSQVGAYTDLGPNYAVSQQAFGTFTKYSIDVTSLVQAVADAPTNWGGFFINVANIDGTGLLTFYTHTRSTTSQRPALTVTTLEED